MEDHRHTPVGFYSDAFDKPLLVKCSECGDTLDVSTDLLEVLHGDDPADNVKYLGMTENGTRHTP